MAKLPGIPDRAGYILIEVLISMLLFSYAVMCVLPVLFQVARTSEIWHSRQLRLDSAVSRIEAFRAGYPVLPSANISLITRSDGVLCLTIQIDAQHALTYYTDAP